MDCIVHGVAKSQTQLSDFHSLHLIMYKDERVTHAQEPGICLSLAVLGSMLHAAFLQLRRSGFCCDGLSRRRAWAPGRAQWLQLPGSQHRLCRGAQA